jgi:hypothetical protein
MDEVVSLVEAARLLGISDRGVLGYIRQGLLANKGGRHPLISLQEVSSVAGLLANGLKLSTIARHALRALVSATRSERRLERIEALLGIDVAMLETDEKDVLQFYNQCTATLLEPTEELPPDSILRWAYSLSGITEEYLALVKYYTNNVEPWAPYMEVAQKLCECAPTEKFKYRKDLEVAYAYLRSARQQLRRVAYFYIRRVYGPRIANAACPGVTVGDRDAGIISLLFPQR